MWIPWKELVAEWDPRKRRRGLVGRQRGVPVVGQLSGRAWSSWDGYMLGILMMFLIIPKAPSSCRTKTPRRPPWIPAPQRKKEQGGRLKQNGEFSRRPVHPLLCKLYTLFNTTCWLCMRRLRCCYPFRPRRCLMKAEQQELFSGEGSFDL